jgi:hypothetical protein
MAATSKRRSLELGHLEQLFHDQAWFTFQGAVATLQLSCPLARQGFPTPPVCHQGELEDLSSKDFQSSTKWHCKCHHCFLMPITKGCNVCLEFSVVHLGTSPSHLNTLNS